MVFDNWPSKIYKFLAGELHLIEKISIFVFELKILPFSSLLYFEGNRLLFSSDILLL